MEGRRVVVPRPDDVPTTGPEDRAPQVVGDVGGDLVWCDARTTAARFYERAGFTVVTGEYDKPGIGPHVGMVEDLVPLTPPELGASLRTRPETPGATRSS